jgi:hypothetical protein
MRSADRERDLAARERRLAAREHLRAEADRPDLRLHREAAALHEAASELHDELARMLDRVETVDALRRCGLEEESRSIAADIAEVSDRLAKFAADLRRAAPDAPP